MSTGSSPHSKHAIALASKLYAQRSLGQYCDVCICINETRFLAHKCVLSANSPKLDGLIQEATKKNGLAQDIEIELHNLNDRGFEHILEYFYTGSLNLNADTIMPVIMAANDLELREVVARCSDVFQLSLLGPNSNSENNNNKLSTLTAVPPSAALSQQHHQLPLQQPQQQQLPLPSADKSHDIKKVIPTLSQNVILADTLQDEKLLSPGNISVHSLYQADEEFAHASSSPIHLCVNEVVLDVNHQELINTMDNNQVDEQKLINTISVSADVASHDFIPNNNNGNAGRGRDCKLMMEQVGRLRLQHQQLQMLQQQQQQGMMKQHYPNYNSSGNEEVPVTSEPEKKKARVRSKSNGSNHDQYAFNTPQHMQNPEAYGGSQLQLNLVPVEPPFRSANHRSVNPPTDFRIVTDEVRQALYSKYDNFKNDAPIGSTCDVSELLQRGKSRNRKTTEQNCLNTTIRLVLDTMQIVESTDPRVEDALILIMDKFETLRNHINNQDIRRSLRIKVRHSIHCKKWRNKKKQLQEPPMINSPDSQYSNLILLKHQENAEDSLHG